MRRKKMTLAELLELHFAECPGITDVHRYVHELKLRQFAKHLGHEPTIDDLTSEVMGKYIASYIQRGRSATTANNHRQFVIQLARIAERADLILKVPRIRKVKTLKRNPRAFFEDQVGRIIGACRQARPLPRRITSLSLANRVGTWTGDDWEILVRLIWETGNRPSCLFTIRFRDITRDGWIMVQAENEKSGFEKLDLIGPELFALIEKRGAERNASPDALILDWPCERRQIWSCFRRDVLKPAGLANEGLSLYGVLKSATSYICREGGEFEAMKYRGHTNVETTRHYLDPRIAFKKSAAVNVLPTLKITAPMPEANEGDNGDNGGNAGAKPGENTPQSLDVSP